MIAMMVATNLIVVVTLGWGLYKQLIIGEPWGDQPLSDMGLIVLFLSTMLVIAAVNIMIFGARLETQIKDNSVYYKFFPFIWNWKYIHRDNIDHYEIKQFKALSEFGGYGYRKRFFKKQTGIIVKGNQGLLLTLHDGRKLMIGTQQPNALGEAMHKIMGKEIDY